MEILFLDLIQVLEIHKDQIDRYGGGVGVRDVGLLNSAVAQPQAGFGDEYFHKDVFEMAAAYLFHIAENQAFVDGNKRTGAAAALVFLELNGYAIRATDDELVDLTLRCGKLGKGEVAAFFRSRSILGGSETTPPE